MSERPTRIGQRVAGLSFPFGEPSDSDMRGTIVKINPQKGMSGGAKSVVTIIWDSGSTARHEDREVAVVDEQ